MSDIESLKNGTIDTSEGDEASAWEERFETQINTFFDEAIARVPGFVDRHLKSFRKTMARSMGPRTGLGDVFISARNLAAGVSKTVGGPDFSTSTFTHDQLTEAFEREVVSSEELESLLKRLFAEFEEEQWSTLAERSAELAGQQHSEIDQVRARLVTQMEKEIAHDPLLAQAIRSGVRIGLPATLGYVLFGKVTFLGGVGTEAAGEVYKRHLDFYRRSLLKLGRFEVPGWVGAVGFAGGLVGTLAVGGVIEYAVNSVRDVKGYYIRQINTARYILLYGENPDLPEGQGMLHVVRGLERQFEKLPELAVDVLSKENELARADEPVEESVARDKSR
ncbi:MAG: hypothetical protein H0U74_03200 [Bradymonadaceae bacterium]|nr:hypothetical protein [Lujinxingiaceae bacterium]